MLCYAAVGTGIYRQAWQLQCEHCHVDPLKPLLPLLRCCSYDIVPCTLLMLAMSSVAPGLASCSSTLQDFYVSPMSYLGPSKTPGKKIETNVIRGCKE